MEENVKVETPTGSVGMARVARGGLPVIYVHGFMGSRHEAFAAGPTRFTILGLDRPGYGWTADTASASVAEAAARLVAALDALGIDRCAIAGISSGGPTALGMAIALGARAEHLFLAAAVADGETVRKAKGMVALMAAMAGISAHGAEPAAFGWRFMPEGARRILIKGWMDGEPFPEHLLPLKPVIVEGILRGNATGVEGRFRGPMRDLEVLTKPWDVDPAAWRGPTTILHGTDDHVVPIAHAQRYQTLLPHARFERLVRCGHVAGAVSVIGAVDHLLGLVSESPAECQTPSTLIS